MKRTFATVFCLAAVIGLAAGPAAADDWAKLGSRTLLLYDGSDTVKIKKDAAVSEIALEVKNLEVRLQKVQVVFADGTEKTVDADQNLRPGITSEPIALGATGALETVTLIVDGSLYVASDRAPTVVFGR